MKEWRLKTVYLDTESESERTGEGEKREGWKEGRMKRREEG